MSERQRNERWRIELKRPEDRQVFEVAGREAAFELIRNWHAAGYRVQTTTMTNRPITTLSPRHFRRTTP